MTVFQIIAILISLTALFSYLNHRYFRLPPTIGAPACHCCRMVSFCSVETRLRRPLLTVGLWFICKRLNRPFKLSKSQLGQTIADIIRYQPD
jgi:hypothetical protein